jgi:hypothetical protein
VPLAVVESSYIGCQCGGSDPMSATGHETDMPGQSPHARCCRGINGVDTDAARSLNVTRSGGHGHAVIIHKPEPNPKLALKTRAGRVQPN